MVEQALLDAFCVAFNVDALSDYDDDQRRVRGLDAASDLVTVLGPRARQASALLRAMIADRRHPFFQPLTNDTQAGWNGDDAQFALFKHLAGIVADAIDVELVTGVLLDRQSDDPRSFDSRRRAHQRWLETGGAEGTRLDRSRVELADLDLTRAPLREALLPEAILVGVTLTEADLRAANLYGLYATWVSFAGARLDGAELVKAELHSTDLSGASLRDARLRRLESERTGFASADFTGADLTGAMLVDADLRGAKFEGADLTHARLTGARIDGITGVPAAADGLRCEWAELNGERVGGAALFVALGLTEQR